METAKIVAFELPTYATPLSTTAGNSRRPPSATLHTVLNGGRSLMWICDCERVAFAPYIGHCSSGRKTRTVTLRESSKRSGRVRVENPGALTVTFRLRRRGTGTRGGA